jgi:hypothetical protein
MDHRKVRDLQFPNAPRVLTSTSPEIQRHESLRDLRAENKRLREERERLASFAREIIEYAFEGQDADGGSIQALAVHYGLLRETKYDPKEHGPSFAQPGDEWFVYTDLLKTSQTMPSGR